LIAKNPKDKGRGTPQHPTMAPHQTYKMKGETEGDFQEAMSLWTDNGIDVEVIHYGVETLNLPTGPMPIGFCLTIRSNASKEKLIYLLEHGMDLHVMIRTMEESTETDEGQ